MAHDQPAPSVTGNRDWEWNSLQADGASGSERNETARRPSSYREENERLREHIRHLQAELDRRERRLQRIVDQYEQLLATRNRQLEEARAEQSSDDDSAELLADVRQRLESR